MRRRETERRRRRGSGKEEGYQGLGKRENRIEQTRGAHYMHAYVHTYINTLPLATIKSGVFDAHACMYAYMQSCMHAYIHTYIH